MSGSGTLSSSGAIACAAASSVRARRSTRRRHRPCARWSSSGKGGAGRHGVVGEEAVQLPRRVREEVAVDREHLGGLARATRTSARRRPCPTVVQPEEERGDDAEVAAAAADRPVEVGVLVGARAHALAVRRAPARPRAGCRSQSPHLRRQVAQAPAEREAADPGGRDDPARASPVRARWWPRRPHPRCSRRRPARSAPAGSTATSFEQREVDHDAVVDRCRGRRRCGRRRARRAAGRAPGRTRSSVATSSASGAAARSAPAGLSIIAL